MRGCMGLVRAFGELGRPSTTRGLSKGRLELLSLNPDRLILPPWGDGREYDASKSEVSFPETGICRAINQSSSGRNQDLVGLYSERQPTIEMVSQVPYYKLNNPNGLGNQMMRGLTPHINGANKGSRTFVIFIDEWVNAALISDTGGNGLLSVLQTNVDPNKGAILFFASGGDFFYTNTLFNKSQRYIITHTINLANPTNQTKMRLYVNGVEKTDTTYSGAAPATMGMGGETCVGAISALTQETKIRLGGLSDYVNRELTPAEVIAEHSYWNKALS